MSDLINTISRNIIHHEGCINHMYLDTNGYVTIGIGFLLPNAESATELHFQNKHTLNPANKKEIIHEYKIIQAMTTGKNAAAYEPYTKLILSKEKIEAELNKRVREIYGQIERKIPNLSTYPTTAQEAVLDMAYNIGAVGLEKKFPRFIRSFIEKNWETCASECHRKGIGNARNTSTSKLFIDCHLNSKSN